MGYEVGMGEQRSKRELNHLGMIHMECSELFLLLSPSNLFSTPQRDLKTDVTVSFLFILFKVLWFFDTTYKDLHNFSTGLPPA